MPRGPMRRLKANQTYQLCEAVKARLKEFAEKTLSMPEACKELSEGLGFAVGASNLATALTAVGLTWPRARAKRPEGAGISARDLLEAVVRELLAMSKELGQTPSPALVRYQAHREEMRNRNGRGRAPTANEAAAETPRFAAAIKG